MKAMALALTTVAAMSASAQTPKHRVITDSAKITDALRAGPRFITRDATILDWPSTPDGEYRILRKGTNDWSCLPGSPQFPHDEPGCFDGVFTQFLKDSFAGRTPHIGGVGIAYMYIGAWVPHQPTPDEPPDRYFHVGPHIMVVTPHQDDLRAFTTNGAAGLAYINHLPGRSEVFLVIPIREWNEPPQ